jgi:hypothetical protein
MPQALPACRLNFGAFAQHHIDRVYEGFLYHRYEGVLVAGCSQVIDQFYSKSNFDMQSFNADISECKKRSSFTARHTAAVETKDQVDDPIVRECMTAKGYVVQSETK